MSGSGAGLGAPALRCDANDSGPLRARRGKQRAEAAAGSLALNRLFQHRGGGLLRL
jgi:hypothetical protein